MTEVLDELDDEDAPKVKHRDKSRRPKLKVKRVRTPDSVKHFRCAKRYKKYEKGEGKENGSGRRAERFYNGRKRPTKVKVVEPVMLMLDAVMTKEGVSDARLESVMGYWDGKMKKLRKDDTPFKILIELRKMFWAMGYDLEMRAVRKHSPHNDLVVRMWELEGAMAHKIYGCKNVGDWNPRKMWGTLGFDELEVESEEQVENDSQLDMFDEDEDWDVKIY